MSDIGGYSKRAGLLTSLGVICCSLVIVCLGVAGIEGILERKVSMRYIKFFVCQLCYRDYHSKHAKMVRRTRFLVSVLLGVAAFIGIVLDSL